MHSVTLKINRKEIKKYLDSFREAVFPNEMEIKARCYYWLGERQSAIEWFNRTVEDKQKTFNTPEFRQLSAQNKGTSCLEMGNMLGKCGNKLQAKKLLESAIDHFKDFLKVSPNNANTWGWIAECHYLLDEYKEILADLEELHKIRPEPYRRFDTLGLLAKAKLENDITAVTEAIELIEAGIKKERLKPYYEGDTFSLWDRYEAALEIVKELDPVKYQELAKDLY
jgi:tetratricopeptide (TPR) repeat protein